MSGGVNLEYLEAEISAWPIASVASFRHALDAIERTGSGDFGPGTREVCDQLMLHLRPIARGLSLEVLAQLRDSIWFESAERPSARTRQCRIPLSRFLLAGASTRLEFSGERVVLRPPPGQTTADAVHRWRWSSLSLPEDVYIAAHAAQLGREPVADHVSLGAPELDGFFASTPLAQPHLHLGAALPFERLWTNLMTRAGDAELSPAQLKGNAGFESPREFLSWLVTAALARLLLASYLFHREKGRTETLGTFLPYVTARLNRPNEVLPAMTAFARGSRPISFAQVRWALRRLTGPVNEHPGSEPLDAVARRDPLFEWLGKARALPETRFLSRGLRFLQTEEDEGFASLFWQYLRIRNLTYRHLVLAPGTAGLDWFSSHFRNIAPLRRGLDERERVSSALELESRGARLDSLEVRTSPSPRWGEVRDLARHVQNAPHIPGRKVARGLVLHFIKEPHTTRPDKLPNADPRQRAHLCRFGAYFHARQQETTAVETTLRRHPQLLKVIRGLDVCHLELSVPTWVFHPLIKRIRDTSARIAHETGRGLQALRLTMHAGEEFRRLSEGLRLVHEPVEFGLIQDRDRLGHAIALGLEPRAWCKEAPFAPQPAEDHLDDLLWEWARYQQAELEPPANRMPYLEQQLARLGSFIYGGNPSTKELLRARELRHSPLFLKAVGYPFIRSPHLRSEWGSAGRLALRYLCDFGVYERGRQPERVITHPTERPMLERAQSFLRGVLADRHVTIEANPTSNMLIGELRLEEHPIFRLQPLRGKGAEGGAPVAVALGSDDPITLATCLPNEFAYVYFELIRSDVDPATALEWLGRIAANGMQARFTV
jgi:hypothetical protein